jgi:hypothetical protein
MKLSTLGVLGAAMLLVVAACSEVVSSTSADDAERAVLIQQVKNLKSSIETGGGLTPELQRELEVVSARVSAWQTRTGRTDLTVTRTSRGGGAHAPALATTGAKASDAAASAAIKGGGGVVEPCGTCPDLTYYADKVCISLGTPICADEPGGLKLCVYQCFYFGPPSRK